MRFFVIRSRAAVCLFALSCLVTTASPVAFAESAVREHAGAQLAAVTPVAPLAAESSADQNDAAPASAPDQRAQSNSKNEKNAKGLLKAKVTSEVLKGTVSEDGKKTPFLTGSIQSIPKGTAIDITFCGNINSEVSQKGDEIMVQVSHDVGSGKSVGVPGGWYMHGLVTDAAAQKRLGRDGYIEIEFDKLVSPDGQYELPFHATVSTKDKMLKTVAKVAAIDSGHVALGAMGGALMSLQFTGVGGAIASQGYSVAIGAGVGATLGAIGALKRKGKVASIYPGDSMKFTTAEPITLPGFDKTMLPSGKKFEPLKDMAITINKTRFEKGPNGDTDANLLTVDLTMANKTPKEYTFFDLAVVSDHNQRYFPSIFNGLQQLHQAVKPNSEQEGVVTFEVESKKRKYWLVLLDRSKQNELTRVPIN